MASRSALDRLIASPPEDLAAARRVARALSGSGSPGLDAADVDQLLWSGAHALRLVAVLVLVHRFRDGSDRERQTVLGQYLDAARAERIDSRELVDLGAEHIVGDWYLGRPRNPLFALAKSDVVWIRRMAVVATIAFVKRGDASTSLEIAGRLVRESGSDIQSAVGWVLREVGKRADLPGLVVFLDRHAARMGSEALALATEHLAPADRARYGV